MQHDARKHASFVNDAHVLADEGELLAAADPVDAAPARADAKKRGDTVVSATAAVSAASVDAPAAAAEV
jgi:hypothetical protein